MIQILHLSDLHINAGYALKTAALRDLLKRNLLDALDRAVTFAVAEQLDAVLIAGDLLDHSILPFAVQDRILRAFERLTDAGVNVFYASGNHDPAETATFLKPVVASESFYLFETEAIRKVTLTARDGTPYCVVGCGHNNAYEKRNLIRTFPVKSDRSIWIGIAHASVQSAEQPEGKGKYMPAGLRDIEGLGYDYFALGHIHKRQRLSERVAYSGDLQGLDPTETGGKGGYVVRLSEGHLAIEEKNFSEVQWLSETLILSSEVQFFDQLSEWLLQTIQNRLQESGISASKSLIRIRLEGRTPLYNELSDSENQAYLETLVKNQLGFLQVELITTDVHRVIDETFLKEEQTVLAEALQAIEHLEQHPELEAMLANLPIPNSQATKSERIQWVKAHKESVQALLIDRMVRREDDY